MTEVSDVPTISSATFNRLVWRVITLVSYLIKRVMHVGVFFKTEICRFFSLAC